MIKIGTPVIRIVLGIASIGVTIASNRLASNELKKTVAEEVARVMTEKN